MQPMLDFYKMQSTMNDYAHHQGQIVLHSLGIISKLLHPLKSWSQKNI